MFKMSDTSRDIVKFMLGTALIALGVGALILMYIEKGDVFNYSKGIVFGTIIAVLKLILLERTLSKSVDMNRAKAQNYARLHYMLRHLLTGVVLVVSALLSKSMLLGTVIGLVTLRPAVYIVGLKYKDKNAAN